ncbi:hypothetical protein, partial [Streptomyces sp. NPDC006333]|uniref:hypothetical protein n=1 Tax=Streptomyces sp. NPDC006333 TaxID=3156753 RepID=UPI0033BA3AF1
EITQEGPDMTVTETAEARTAGASPSDDPTPKVVAEARQADSVTATAWSPRAVPREIMRWPLVFDSKGKMKNLAATGTGTCHRVSTRVRAEQHATAS